MEMILFAIASGCLLAGVLFVFLTKDEECEWCDNNGEGGCNEEGCERNTNPICKEDCSKEKCKGDCNE